MDDRYQHQPWYIKLYRNLRYQPISVVSSIYWSLAALGHKNRWRKIGFIWSLRKGLVQMDMKFYYTMEELTLTLFPDGDDESIQTD